LLRFIKIQPAEKENIIKQQYAAHYYVYYQYPTHCANKKERTQIPIEYINKGA
jgi:hypothetical protein